MADTEFTVGSEVIVSSGEKDEVLRAKVLENNKTESEEQEVEGSTCKRKREFTDEANVEDIFANQTIEDMQRKHQQLVDERNKCERELDKAVKKLGVIDVQIAKVRTLLERGRKVGAEFEKLVAAPFT